MTEYQGLTPYDLRLPSRLLVPYPHKRRNFRKRTVNLGDGEGAAVLEVASWDPCLSSCNSPAGSHDAGRTVRLRVPCDSLPHCNACECGSGHDLLLADEQVRQLLAALA